MAHRYRAARHARPSRRGALERAYTDLQAELSRVRADRYAADLEAITLHALVDRLAADSSRLSLELLDLRREIAEVRARPPGPDPLVLLLAEQAAELRATVAAQQELLRELSERMVDLLTVTAWPPVLDAPEETVEVIAVEQAAEEPDDVEPTSHGSVVALTRATGRRAGGRTIDARDVSARIAAERDEARATDEPRGRHGRADEPTGDESDLDDETVLRLRMIRQAFDG